MESKYYLLTVTMDWKTFILLVVPIIAIGMAVYVNGQGASFGMYPGGGGGWPGHGGGGGWPGHGGGGWPGHGGGGWPGHGGGGWPGHGGGGWPGHGGGCQCRRYCFRGETYAGRCHRRRWGYHGGGGRRLVRCCPMYGHYN